jgi:AcrR family transcriptional regulator
MPIQTERSIRKEKIVAAAAQLFARQGYHGTSTREIARLADVSENTLFRHFDRKEDLFWFSLRSRCSAIKLRRDMLDGMNDGEALEVILPKLIEFLSDILKFSPDLLRLIAVALLEMQWKAGAFCDECLAPAFSAIKRYIANGVQQGRIRKLDPAMVTTALTAMVLVHPWFSLHAEEANTSFADSRAAECAYTAFWLEVLTPTKSSNDRALHHVRNRIFR